MSRSNGVSKQKVTKKPVHAIRRKLIIGNWKMNPRTLAEARTLFTNTKKQLSRTSTVDVALAVPFVYLPELKNLATAGLKLAAQTVGALKEGAATGEVSATMLAACRVSFTIVGHSERRAMGETNDLINKKILMLLSAKITPVLCVGELERDQGMWYLGAIKTQLEECLRGVPKSALKKLVIAYEPVWAISTTPGRRDATPEDCHEMIIYIRKVLADLYGHDVPKHVRILYGGSVNEKNADMFLLQGFADGLLPGRASLSPQTFITIITVANDIR